MALDLLLLFLGVDSQRGQRPERSPRSVLGVPEPSGLGRDVTRVPVDVTTALGDRGDTDLPPLGQPEVFAKCFGIPGVGEGV